MKKLKTKNQDAQKKRSSHKFRGVSPKGGRESMVVMICERDIGLSLDPGVKERSYEW